MERIERAIAFPGLYVCALGAALVLVGTVVPAGMAYVRTLSYVPADLSIKAIGDGPLRPSMVMLPPMPDGKQFLISERPVTFGEFIRVVGQIATVQRCGVEGLTENDLESPVNCKSTIREAAYYSNLLTDQENKARRLSNRTLLTNCYKVAEKNDIDPSCTGYRLPTIEEWTYAATGGSVTPDTSGPQAQTAGHDHQGCRADEWFILGMCGTLELAVAAKPNRGPVAIIAEGPALVTSEYGPGSAATFRIVRLASGTDPI
jgi:hypothetical protein